MAKPSSSNLSTRDLAALLAAHSGLTKTKAEESLRALLHDIAEHVMDGGKIAIMGFGTFTARLRPARTGRNPKTGAAVPIPARKVFAFRGSKSLTVEVKASPKKSKK